MSTQLTIQIAGRDDRLSVEALLNVIRDAAEALAQVSAEVAPAGEDAPAWEVVSASMRSPFQVTLAPRGGEVQKEVGGAAVSVLLDGVRNLERSPARPPHFNQSTLRAVRSLLGTVAAGVFVAFTAQDPQQPDIDMVVPSAGAIPNVEQALKMADRPYMEYGTIEGDLEVISVRAENSCSVWEAVTNRRVRCRLTDDQLVWAKESLGRRVAVTGTIKYRKKGEPVEVQVDRIRVLRPTTVPPPIIDVTDGLPSEKHVRRLRDGD